MKIKIEPKSFNIWCNEVNAPLKVIHSELEFLVKPIITIGRIILCYKRIAAIHGDEIYLYKNEYKAIVAKMICDYEQYGIIVPGQLELTLVIKKDIDN